MRARVELAKPRREAAGAAETGAVIDERLREITGLARREGWQMLAYLLRVAHLQLKEELKQIDTGCL